MYRYSKILEKTVQARAMKLIFIPIVPDLDSGDIDVLFFTLCHLTFDIISSCNVLCFFQNTFVGRITLYTYITVAGLTTSIIVLLMMASDPKNRGFGPMSCTHDPVTLQFRQQLDGFCKHWPLIAH